MVRSVEDAGARIVRLLDEVDLAGMQGWVLSSLDGRALVGDLGGELGSAAAVVASAHALAARTGELLGSGEVLEAIVRTSDGIVASYAVGDAAVLTLAVDDRSNLGQVGHAARQVVPEIAGAVAGLRPPRARSARAAARRAAR